MVFPASSGRSEGGLLSERESSEFFDDMERELLEGMAELEGWAEFIRPTSEPVRLDPEEAWPD